MALTKKERSLWQKYYQKVKTGTKKKDKITWVNSKAWKKALTVNAGKGNDVINFKKSKYKNTLNGQDGKDTIYGGKNNDKINGGNHNDKLYGYAGNDKIYGGNGNDKITGGTGNDIIYTGKGTNTLYINKGDGNDTIYHQGKKTVIKVNKAKSNDTQGFEKKGNDLIMTYTHGGTTTKEITTIKNYFTGNKNIYLGNKKLETLISKTGLTVTGSGNITGTNYNDTIFASANNDSITAGKGNDVINAREGDDSIYGGAGADIINADAGRNTIDHSAGDGNDVIIAGGGKDKLSFGGVNSINDITASFIGNDVVFSTPNGETVTLQNALINAHSVDTIEIGDDKYAADTFKNYINSSSDTVNGTAWHDDIQITSYHMFSDIYAGAGNDIIHVTENSNVPDIYVGAGDDTISIDDNNSSCIIEFENGDGNNTLRGLTNSISTSSDIELLSYDLFHSIRLSSSLSYNYITGAKEGNNLVLSLTDGETFTIGNYYNLSQDKKDQIQVYDFYGEHHQPVKLSKYLRLETDIVHIDDEVYERADEEHVYDVYEDGKTLIAPEADYSREFWATGDENNIVVQGSEQEILLQGDNNKIYAGGEDVRFNFDNNYTGNKIYFDGTDCTIMTSYGGSTYAEISCTDYSDISLSGDDNFKLKKGTYQINVTGFNNDINITLDTFTKKVEIDQITYAKSTEIYQNFEDWVSNLSDIMFEHYSDWKDDDGILYFYDHLSIVYTDENGAAQKVQNNNELILKGQGYINDGKFNLDDKTVGDTVTVRATTDFGDDISKTLSEMSQYVDMNNNAIGTDDSYKKYTLGEGILNIATDVYVNGTTGDDYYTTGEKSIINLDKSFTVSDKGGNEDILFIDNNYQNTRFFMDIDINQQIASDDLYIFYHSNDGIGSEAGQQASGLYQYFSRNIGNYGEENGYIVVENEFDSSESTFTYGTGKIEYINASDTVGGISIQNHFNTIKADVAAWLGAFNTAYDTSCNTVTEAIESGNNIWTVNYQGHNLYDIYSQPYNV